MSNAPAATAIYLYCLAMPECLPVIDVQELTGIDERYPVTMLGDNEDGVLTVIGEVDPVEFSESNLQTLSWLGLRAQRHEAVVERIMNASAVLPVKFGTLFKSCNSLREFMSRHKAVISMALAELKGKAEWSVKGYLADEQARTNVAASDAGIQTRLAALSPSPGARYIQQRQLEARIDAAVQAWLGRVSSDIHSAMMLHAAASTTLRCHPAAITGRAERMVFNTSYLLAVESISSFLAALEGQQAAYRDSGLVLELQGPWPPYNFCPSLAS